jgi:hypothetical protein
MRDVEDVPMDIPSLGEEVEVCLDQGGSVTIHGLELRLSLAVGKMRDVESVSVDPPSSGEEDEVGLDKRGFVVINGVELELGLGTGLGVNDAVGEMRNVEGVPVENVPVVPRIVVMEDRKESCGSAIVVRRRTENQKGRRYMLKVGTMRKGKLKMAFTRHMLTLPQYLYLYSIVVVCIPKALWYHGMAS